jgi:hypothetical protein
VKSREISIADIFKTRTRSIMDLDYIEMREEKAKSMFDCN